MNKKILYSLIFTSLFVISAFSFVTPASQGYSFGVPDAAKGMDLESEVKVYDKDGWGDALGPCKDKMVSEKFDGDATKVGAKSKSVISDWEKADINFFGDYLMKNDVTVDCVTGELPVVLGNTLYTYWDANDAISKGLASLAVPNANPLLMGKVYLLSYALGAGIQTYEAIVGDFTTGINTTILMQGGMAVAEYAASTDDNAEVNALWGTAYKGVEVERDAWYFTDESYDSDADEEEDLIPFIEDPHDIYASYTRFTTFLETTFDRIDDIAQTLVTLNQTLDDCAHNVYGQEGEDAWGYINSTIGGILQALGATNPYFFPGCMSMSNDTSLTVGVGANFPELFIDVLLNPDGPDSSKYPREPISGYPAHISANPIATATGQKGTYYIEPYFRDMAPMGEKEYLALMFQGGIPASQGVERWLDKVIDDFNINEDLYWGTLDDPNTVADESDDQHKGGITVDGLVVTVEYEWAVGVLGVDGVNQRDDYEIEYTYGDTGGQSSVVYQAGDDIFYKTESLSPAIPGFEVTILLGTAAIATLGLVYVIMKKRKK